LLLAALLLAPAALPAADAPPSPPPLPAAAGATPTSAPSPHDIVKDTVDKVLKILADPGYKDFGPSAGTARTDPADRSEGRGHGADRQADVGPVPLEVRRETVQPLLRPLLTSRIHDLHLPHGEVQRPEGRVLNTENKAEGRVLVHTKTLDEAGEIPVDYSLFSANGVLENSTMSRSRASLGPELQVAVHRDPREQKPDQLNDRIETKVKENEENLRRDVTPAPDPATPKQGEAK